MPRLAANLSYLFTEVPFLERFEAAAAAGFDVVEYSYAYDVPHKELRARLRENGLSLALLNTPLGDAARGEVGLAVLPGRERDAEAAFEQALRYAVALEVPLIHFLAGIVPEGADRAARTRLFIRHLGAAADRAAREGIALTLEPLNARDRPGYFLRTNAQAQEIIEACGRDNVKLQLDLYHCQISEGDLTRSIRSHCVHLAHVQIAGVPDRTEPTFGEVAYARVLDELDAVGYSGSVGCEYSPARGTWQGLVWATPYLARAPAASVSG